VILQFGKTLLFGKNYSLVRSYFFFSFFLEVVYDEYCFFFLDELSQNFKSHGEREEALSTLTVSLFVPFGKFLSISFKKENIH
jgi:hypothetical protein